MNLTELARSGARLLRIRCSEHNATTQVVGLSGLVFEFEGEPMLAIGIDPNTDELVWERAVPASTGMGDLAQVCPSVAAAYGLRLTWSWEMKNHQGYFDALQLELTDDTLQHAVVLQIKVAASRIQVFDVLQSARKRKRKRVSS